MSPADIPAFVEHTYTHHDDNLMVGNFGLVVFRHYSSGLVGYDDVSLAQSVTRTNKQMAAATRTNDLIQSGENYFCSQNHMCVWSFARGLSTLISLHCILQNGIRTCLCFVF